jgi:hypothetical protein
MNFFCTSARTALRWHKLSPRFGGLEPQVAEHSVYGNGARLRLRPFSVRGDRPW